MLCIRYILPMMALVTGLAAIAVPAHAQERAAGSALETQMTWSALRSLVEDANATSKAVDTRLTVVNDNLGKVKGRVDLIENCNLKGKIYSPGKGGDEDDCITPNSVIDETYVRKVEFTDAVVNCNLKGGVFRPSAPAAGAGWKPGDKVGTCVTQVDPLDDKVITNRSKTFCSRDRGPFSIVATCAAGERLVACAGGPGDQKEVAEYWIIEPDFKKRSCTGHVSNPSCHVDNKASLPKGHPDYYSQIIVTAICAK